MTDAEKQAKEMLYAVGSMGELAALYFNTLTKNGVPEQYAAQMASAFFQQILKSQNKEEN